MIWSVVVPLAGGLAALLAPRRAARIAILTSVATLAVALALTRAVALDGALEHRPGGWPPPLGIRLVVDGVGVLFLLLVALVFVAATVYGASFFDPVETDRIDTGREAYDAEASDHAVRKGPRAPEGFWALWLFALASLDGLFLTADLFNMYVAIELLTLASVGLVAITNDRASVTAALRYLLAGMVASLFFLLGISLLYAEYGVLDLEALATAISAATDPASATGVALPLILTGLAVKAALFPFHFWLPPAHGSAFSPVSAVLSGLVVKGPFFVLLRLVTGPFAPVVPEAAGLALGALAVVGILWGSVRALQQPRLKLLIAYSTVAQIGYLFLALGLAISDPAGPAVRGGVVYALAHGCAKASMFLALGAIVRSTGHDRIRRLIAPQRGAPIAVSAFAVAGLAIMGFPPSGGFVGKLLIGEAATGADQWWTLAGLIVGGLLAALYLFRVFRRVFVAVPDDTAPLPRAPLGLEVPALALAVVSLLLGLAAALPLGLVS
ncbi:MAG: proton-conducting transporter membrane subunit [Gemmatimonadota bacterium]|nr:proton-conducting transporter membrane subunit [Gemmatimonadota bacterium]